MEDFPVGELFVFLCSGSSRGRSTVASHRRQENQRSQLWISCQCDGHDAVDVPGVCMKSTCLLRIRDRD